METSKLKNIFILILLGLNIFLVILCFLDRDASAQADEAALQAVEEILSANGIALDRGVDLTIQAPPVYTVRRNMELEKDKLSKLLGQTSADDLGGNIIYYGSASGQASARGTGELDVLLTSGSVSRGREPVKTAEKVLGKLGMDAVTEYASVSGSAGSTTVSIPYAYEGFTVYNSRMDLTFGASELLMITGTRLFDEETSADSQQACDSYSALMYFLASVRDTGYVCSELRDMDVGYFMSVTVSGECTLTPVWRFDTDTGSIYINSLTGRAETLY